MCTRKLSIFAILLVLYNGRVYSYMVDNNPNRHMEMLDPHGKYRLEWLVDRERNRIIFSVIVETHGYVGFGLTKSGKMSGADIVIGGVLPNGKAYLSDRHAIGNKLPEVDYHQDWQLHAAWETESHTSLTFSRELDTCDNQDFPITDDKIAVIWAYGEEDNGFEYHYRNRGIYNVYLLSPNYSPKIEYQYDFVEEPPTVIGYSDVKTWTTRRKMELPQVHTVYWCTMHQAPKLQRKHHAIGYQIRFGSDASRKHTHHFIMYRCHAPPGKNAKELFGPFVEEKGQSCLSIRESETAGPMPTQYCTDMFQVWGIGGRTYFHPTHVGQAFGESEDEYYVVQVHYSNPEQTSNIPIDSSIDIFYTSMLRPNEGANMVFRHAGPASLPPSFLIPPSSVGHKIFAHCSPECTRIMFPPSGINISSIYLHSHNSGRQIRLQHFRNHVELPWISSDDNYDNQYQQVRALSEDVHVLPGDQLTARCVYDSTWTNSTVVGGFSTSQEMCAIVVFYHTRIKNYGHCDSQIVSEEYRKHFLGIDRIKRGPTDLEYLVVEPKTLEGWTITEVSDHDVKWNRKLRSELDTFHLYHPQNSSCPTGLWAEYPQYLSFASSYPLAAREYHRPNVCEQNKVVHYIYHD